MPSFRWNTLGKCNSNLRVTHSCVKALASWRVPQTVSVWDRSGVGLHKESMSRRIRFLVGPGAVLANQLPGNDGSFSQGHPARYEGASRPGPLGQHDGGSLHKPPRGTLYKLERSLLLWAQHNICSVKAVQVPDRLNGHAVPEQSVSRGMETPSPNVSDGLHCLRASGSQTLCLLAQLVLVCLPPGSSSPSGH